jgi:signal recognition particle GTPase
MKVTFDSDKEEEEMDENENKEKKEGRKQAPNIPVKEIGELLDEVSTKIPKLLDGIQKSYYSVENGTNAGKSIGAFYKELLAAGMSQDVALRLTERFMVSVKDFTDLGKKNKDE